MTDPNNFFPETDYKIPETSNWLKFTEGTHNFRVLSSAIIGYEYFNKDSKPVRSRTAFEGTPSDLKEGNRTSHFWAFVVYNYESKRIQILEVTQKTIQEPLLALINNPKWGNPKNYDITITRTGTTMNDTEYTVMPNPHTALDQSIVDLYNKQNIQLDAMYEGIDPFKVD